MRSLMTFLLISLSVSCFAVDFSLPTFLEQKEGYSWQMEKKEEKIGYTVHVLRLKSQTWQTTTEVDRPLWEHELRLTIPHTLRHPEALVQVLGGSLGGSLTSSSPTLLESTLSSGTILAELSLIPVQPLLFSSEQKGRTEDAIVAYSWRKFLETKDASWPLHLPMAKAITRAMDSIQEYCQQQKLTPPKNFVLLGESKRAWAAWITAAADPRVKGIIPVSCDFLNVKSCFIHQYCSLGAWSVAIRDYLAEGINEKTLQLPVFDELMQLEDPYTHRTAYTMPKFLIQAAGDPFSSPDASHFYFRDLPAPKYLRYLPNVGHKLPPHEIANSASTFYLSLIGHKLLPELRWEKQTDGSLHITTDTLPLKVTIWRAKNPESRDFRYDFTKVRWQSEDVSVQSSGSYHIKPLIEDKGWTAFFVEYTFPNPIAAPAGHPLIFTTEVMIAPDTLPFSLPTPSP